MSRFYVRLFILLSVLLGTLAGAMMALGSANASTQPTLRGFESGCERWMLVCWYGIEVHRHPISEADEALQALGYLYQGNGGDPDGDFMRYQGSDCALNMYYWEGVVDRIDLYNCQNLVLGDIIAQFDEPTFFYMRADGRGRLVYLDYGVEAYFSHGLDLLEPIDRLTIGDYLSATDSFEWYGYIPYWRYCQIHWDNYGCEFG
jgi:hypothetical protein